eukprot:6470260-Amphidinium_carterae.3
MGGTHTTAIRSNGCQPDLQRALSKMDSHVCEVHGGFPLRAALAWLLGRSQQIGTRYTGGFEELQFSCGSGST